MAKTRSQNFYMGKELMTYGTRRREIKPNHLKLKCIQRSLYPG